VGDNTGAVKTADGWGGGDVGRFPQPHKADSITKVATHPANLLAAMRGRRPFTAL
jgi:hypothetical protein